MKKLIYFSLSIIISFSSFAQQGSKKNKKSKIEIKADEAFLVQNYYDALTQNIKLLNLENQNRAVAKLNMERTKDLFNNGSITSLQFRQAQLNLLQIENRINNLNYVIKVYDYQLLRMTNELVK